MPISCITLEIVCGHMQGSFPSHMSCSYLYHDGYTSGCVVNIRGTLRMKTTNRTALIINRICDTEA